MSPILQATCSIVSLLCLIAGIYVVYQHSAVNRRALIEILKRKPLAARQILIEAGVKEEELR